MAISPSARKANHGAAVRQPGSLLRPDQRRRVETVAAANGDSADDLIAETERIIVATARMSPSQVRLWVIRDLAEAQDHVDSPGSPGRLSNGRTGLQPVDDHDHTGIG